MQIKTTLLYPLLLHFLLAEGKVYKCGDSMLRRCFCDNQFVGRENVFMVNCTDLGFTDAEVLAHLPEETEWLVFTGNQVDTLPVNVLGGNKNLTKLRVIDMSKNGIKDIKGKAFHHVPSVTRLILNHNNITISDQYDQNYHHPRVFSNFLNLEELHLTNAFADNTDAALADDLHDIFVNSNLTKLYKLHLEQNEIKNFRDDRVFCDLPNLHQLYLADNNIPRLNFNISCLPKLHFLDLEYNNITRFSQPDLDTFDRLAHHPEGFAIKFNGNPFRCDSAIKNFYAWLQDTKVAVKDKTELQCHQAKYGTKVIWNLSDLVATTRAKISQALMIVLVILVFVLLTLIGAYVYLKKESLKNNWRPILESVSRKVQYNKIETQDV